MTKPPSMLPPISISREELSSLRQTRDWLAKLNASLAAEAALGVQERIALTLKRQTVADKVAGMVGEKYANEETVAAADFVKTNDKYSPTNRRWWEVLWTTLFRK